MINLRYIGSIVLFVTFAFSSFALMGEGVSEPNDSEKNSYSVAAGLSVGGVMPIPMPVEIRSIEHYSPSASFFVEGSVEHSLSQNWSLSGGLRLENKGMETVAKVKNYKMEMSQDEDVMAGYWTGTVSTTADVWALSVPILAVYNLNRTKLKAGPYLSYLFSKDFSGTVYDGYLRDQTPIGMKTEIEADSPASYDFSDDVQAFRYGIQLGAETRLYNNIGLALNVVMDINDFFVQDFDVVTFDMHPFYVNIGISYCF